MTDARLGGCQCGSIRYAVTVEPAALYACHCRTCQRESGSAFAMTMVVPLSGFRLLRGQPKPFHRTHESGRLKVSWFCQVCGTRLYNEPGTFEESINLKAGTLDDTSRLQPAAHLWTRSAQSWVPIPADAPRLDTQPEDPGWLLEPAEPLEAEGRSGG